MYSSNLKSNNSSLDILKSMILDEYYPIEQSESILEFENHGRIHEKSQNFLKEFQRPGIVHINREELDAFYQELEDLDLSDESPTTSVSTDKHPSLEQMTFIYIVSNQIYSQNHMFKIGKHKGTKKMLIKRYKTYLIDPIVYFFFPTGTVSSDEAALLDRFSKFRMGTSEFLQMPIDKLLDGVHLYFKTKYQRNPSVQIPYHRCMLQQELYDLAEKRIQFNGVGLDGVPVRGHYKKCGFFPYLDFSNPNDCLKRVEMICEGKKIFHLEFSRLEMDLLMNPSVIDFIRCFMIDFEKKNYVMYLDRFVENGLNDFFVEAMKRIYGYQSFKVLTRKEFLQKETFSERILLIQKSDEPMDILLEKIQMLECCVLIEDRNIYAVSNKECMSVTNKEMGSFEDLFFYFFYVL
jgi:hypothetical protein